MREATIPEMLDQNIPAEVVETREAWRGGPTLSYLTGAYVIKRLNEVLGQGNWGYGISELTKVFEGTVEQSSGSVYTVSYISQISFTGSIGESKFNFIEVGYGDGTDKKSPGKAHELATKEAVTDGLKRAAKNLGISLGLGLYFKSGEYVDEAITAEPSKRETTKADTPTPKNEEKGVGGGVTATPGVPKSSSATAKTIREQIKNSFAVLQAQKKITKEVFIKDYLGGAKVDDLMDTTAIVILKNIKTNFPELGK